MRIHKVTTTNFGYPNIPVNENQRYRPDIDLLAFPLNEGAFVLVKPDEIVDFAVEHGRLLVNPPKIEWKNEYNATAKVWLVPKEVFWSGKYPGWMEIVKDEGSQVRVAEGQAN